MQTLTRAWIEADALASILEAFAGAEGREPCGLLLGTVSAPAVRIREAPEAPNTHPRAAEACRIAPHDILGVVREARKGGLTVVGFWHGHLASGPAPGQADLEELVAAADWAPAARVLVIAGRGGGRAPVVRAWTRGPNGTRELPLAR